MAETSKEEQVASLTHACPPGMIWDPGAGRCISIVKGDKLAKKPARNYQILRERTA